MEPDHRAAAGSPTPPRGPEVNADKKNPSGKNPPRAEVGDTCRPGRDLSSNSDHGIVMYSRKKCEGRSVFVFGYLAV
ncbi:hypothetical protein F2P81_007187 [Scophthalmus maximus]|uniref:Uncharacterized protein n=1 Tax=Scophthalmus maximus TaxID=52904 RepID=A0A6A4T8V7_SCOMX|nr:hypothetical protein F2P81_007187 [Scophthalmus maximus]